MITSQSILEELHVGFYPHSLGLEHLKRKSNWETELKICCDSVVPNLNDFPTTRFYGSKRRQLQWLASELKHLKGITALDAFGGTGAVSFLLNRLGWRVTYNDIFEFNVVSARAIFGENEKLISQSELSDFLGRIRPFDGFITQTFPDLYFTNDENRWLDGAMIQLQNLDAQRKNVLLYLIFQACLKKRPFNLFHRANLHLRSSQVPVKFGNRTTWNKTFGEHIYTSYADLCKLDRSELNAVSINDPTCAKEISGGFDLIYVDPPYFKKSKAKTDTYLQRYHFLEGLARYSEWDSLIDFSSPIKSMKFPYRNEIVRKTSLISDLERLVSQHENSSFILSYVSDEDPTEEELYSFFKKNFDKVRLSRRSFNKVLSNKKSFELLLIGR